MSTDRNKNCRWIFTLNNYTPADMAAFVALEPDVLYGIVGEECGESGTRHMQAYLHFKKRMYLSGVSKIFPRAHWAIAKGTEQENWVYCSKETVYTEIGVRQDKARSTRTSASRKRDREQEWEETRVLAIAGQLTSICAEHYVKHYSNLRRIAQDNPCRHDTLDIELEKTNLWIYGKPGTGKSRFARWVCNEGQYNKNANKWWDGYKDEHDALIDDFDKSHHVLAHHVKIWADRYGFTAETKGSSSTIRPSRIIVTSNYAIHDIGWDDVTIDAMRRRFKEVEFNEEIPLSGFEEHANDLHIPRTHLEIDQIVEVDSDRESNVEGIRDLLDEEEHQEIEHMHGYGTPGTRPASPDLSEHDYVTRQKRIYYKHPRKPVQIIDLTQDDDAEVQHFTQEQNDMDEEEEYFNMHN